MGLQHGVLFGIALGGLFAVSSWTGLAAEEEAISSDYGFQALEIFKLERRSENLVMGDFNHDGRRDLLLVDNSHSRLDLLLQRSEKPKKNEPPANGNDVNAITYDWRFDHQKIPVDKEVSAVAVGDLNHDGWDDVAYFGQPDRLIVRYQTDSAEWSERLNVRLADVPKAPWILAAGDLNSDGRCDLVVLGKTQTYLLYQQDDGTLGTPQNLMNTSDQLGLAQIADVNGDGRNDLACTADQEGERALCVRLQNAGGKLGPELVFDLNRPRSVTLADLDGEPGKEIFVVDSRTNRVHVFKLELPKEQPTEPESRIIQYGFGESGTGRDRDLAIGDVDGDGRLDVAVTDPSSAQLLVFRQRKDQGLDSGTTFPALVGATQVRIGQFGGSIGVLILSPREKTLGQSRFEDERLTFPESLPLPAEPLAFELTDLNGDQTPEVVCIGKKNTGDYVLSALEWAVKDGWKPRPIAGEDSLKLDLRNPPERMQQVDANQDGRPDFLVYFGGGRAPVLLLTDEKGVPRLAETQGGIQLGDVSRGSVFVKAPVPSKDANKTPRGALLAAQDTFARELLWENESKQWRVLDQYNAAESSARIEGVAALDLDGQPGEEVVLVDTGIKKLRILRQENSLYRRWREIELGEFPFVALRVADLDADDRDDVVVFGRNKFGVVYAGRNDLALQRIASYETKLDQVHFSDVAVGDLNGDDRIDLAVMDTRSHYVELLSYEPEQGLKRALHFKVFEEKSFSRSGTPGNEPRESLITDVTGDGRADLLLLAHDRVLLYPQAAGPE